VNAAHFLKHWYMEELDWYSEVSVLPVDYSLDLQQGWKWMPPVEAALLKVGTVQDLACYQEAFDSLAGFQDTHFVALDEASRQEQMLGYLPVLVNAQVVLRMLEVLYWKMKVIL